MCLDQVEKEFSGVLLLEWKSFLLRPYPEPKPLEKFRRYTESWMRVAAAPGAARFRVWSTDEDPPSHSVPPNVAVKAAARQGAFARYHMAILDAYFYANRNVTSRDTILAIAAECGLDLAAFERDFDDPAVEREVLDDYREALDIGIGGVPNVVVDGLFPIPGAQEKRLYVSIVEKALAKKSAG